MEQVTKAIQESPIFKEEIKRLNTRAELTGMSQESALYQVLRKEIILKVLMTDEDVYNIIAEDVYKTLKGDK